MLPLTRIKITVDPAPTKYARAPKRATKAGYRAMAEYWSKHFRPMRFRRGAQARYGFQQRKPRYRSRKRRLANANVRLKDYAPPFDTVREGGTRALVYTGLARHKMLLPPIVKAFPTRATVRMHAPSYFKIKPKSGQPSLYEEATRVIPSEKRKLEQVAQKRAERELKGMRGGSKYTVVIGA
jgi:hypothetical protein